MNRLHRPGQRALRLAVALTVALALHGAILIGVAVQPKGVSAPAANRSRPLSLLLVERPPAISQETKAPSPIRHREPPALAREEQRTESPSDERSSAVQTPSQQEEPIEPPASTSAPVEVALRRTVPEPANRRELSFLERVVAAGSEVPAVGIGALDRALDRPDPYASLVPGVNGADILRRSPATSTIREALVPTADGGYSYQGSQIRAEIFADGTVVLYDPPHIRARILGIPVERLPLLFRDPRAEIRRAIAERRQELGGGKEPGGVPLRDEVKDALAALHLVLTAPIVPGTFDITASAMRLVGEDPYASIKACFLTETEALRDQLQGRHHMRQERLALDQLEARLCQIWGDEEQPAAARRVALFELWDDCNDADVGVRARGIIVAFIQRRLPRESADAFTADELSILNARRTSAAPFSPYRL